MLQGAEQKVRLSGDWIMLGRAVAADKHGDRSGTLSRFDIEPKIADHDYAPGRDAPLSANVMNRPGIGLGRPIVTCYDRIELEPAARNHLFGHSAAIPRHHRLSHVEAVQLLEQFGYAAQQNGALRSFPFIAFEYPLTAPGARRLHPFERLQYRFALRQSHFPSDRIEIQAGVDQRPVQIENEAVYLEARRVG